MWCKSLTLEKYISFRMKWFFSPPFLSGSPFLLLNLVRRRCYAYAVGLYTRPEIKSWPDVKFCAHAHCVLPQCLPGDHLKRKLSKFINYPRRKLELNKTVMSVYTSERESGELARVPLRWLYSNSWFFNINIRRWMSLSNVRYLRYIANNAIT